MKWKKKKKNCVQDIKVILIFAIYSLLLEKNLRIKRSNYPMQIFILNLFSKASDIHTQTPSSDRSVYILKWKTVLGFSQINNSNRLAYSSSFTYAVLLGRSVARSFTSQFTSQWVIYHFPACGYIHFSIQSSPLCPSLLLTFQIQSAAHVLLFH